MLAFHGSSRSMRCALFNSLLSFLEFTGMHSTITYRSETIRNRQNKSMASCCAEGDDAAVDKKTTRENGALRNLPRDVSTSKASSF